MMRVVKIGGRAQRDPMLATLLANAWHEAPGTLCVVHGGGDEISTLQRALGVEPRFSGGRRHTGAQDIEIARMVLSGSANKRVVSALVSLGVEAIGVSGEDAALISAVRHEDQSLGLVGTPDSVNARLLTYLLDGGFLPVVSPLARALGGSGTAGPDTLNVNGDDAAAAIAVALHADELLLIADVIGVHVNDSIPSSMDVAEAEDMIASGRATDGMIAKLEAAIRALNQGVEQVRIGDSATLSDPGSGTRITLSESFV